MSNMGEVAHRDTREEVRLAKAARSKASKQGAGRGAAFAASALLGGALVLLLLVAVGVGVFIGLAHFGKLPEPAMERAAAAAPALFKQAKSIMGMEGQEL